VNEHRIDNDELYAHPGWQWCTAEGARRHTQLLGLQSTFLDKLHWLEQAEALTHWMNEAAAPACEVRTDSLQTQKQ
jgi:hypothetical protein